jgi:pimeloyl-ACP methyl ester carboxylesterase
VYATVRLLAAVAVAAVALVVSALAAPAETRGTTTASSSFPARCSFWRSTTVQVDWYAPVTTPKALVYLQHGWIGSSRQMRDAALAFTADGYLVAVPTIPSISVSCGLNSEGFIRSLGPALADGTITDSGRRALGARWPGEPDRMVLAGHSVGAAIASLLASDPALRDRVALVIHLDAVESRSAYLHAALQADTTTPILQLVAPPSSLNADNSGPHVVGTFRSGGSYAPGTDGALITSGSHCDPLGEYPLNICGSTAKNQRAFFDLAVAGANQALGMPGPQFDDVLERLGSLAVRTPHVTTG